MTAPRVAVQVCTLCGEDRVAASETIPGRRLYERLAAAAAAEPGLEVEPVACMAVCDRGVTVAFRGSPDRWTYVVGGLDPDADLADLLAAARAVAASPQGIPAMADRPAFFRAGVVCRLPPSGADGL